MVTLVDSGVVASKFAESLYQADVVKMKFKEKGRLFRLKKMHFRQWSEEC